MTRSIRTPAGKDQWVTGFVQPAPADEFGKTVQAEVRPSPPPPSPIHLPTHSELVGIGAHYLDRIYDLRGRSMPQLRDGDALDHGDREWVAKRREKLAQMVEGRIRLVPRLLLDIGELLMHRDHALETFKRLGRRVPTYWLAAGTALALRRYDGSTRPLDSLRARSILALTILLWLFARPNPAGGPQWGYIVRGLPYGAWCVLLGVWEFGSKVKRYPAFTTLFGRHRVGGRYDRGQVGYLTAFKQAGLVRSKQLPWFQVPSGMRGKPRINAKGEWECWAFAQLELRIPQPGIRQLELGPPPLEREYLPPPPVEPAPAPPQAPIEPAPAADPTLLEAARTGPSEAFLRRFAPATPVPEAPHAGPSFDTWLATRKPFWADTLPADDGADERGPPSTR